MSIQGYSNIDLNRKIGYWKNMGDNNCLKNFTSFVFRLFFFFCFFLFTNLHKSGQSRINKK